MSTENPAPAPAPASVPSPKAADKDRPTPKPQSFWEHLDELRSAVIKILIAVCAFTVAAFCFKGFLFKIVLAPNRPDFVFYRMLKQAGILADRLLPLHSEAFQNFHINVISTGLADQFLIHMKVAFYAGLLLSMPYILYQIFRFVSPALYTRERKYAVRVVSWGYLLFMLGVLIAYLLIFPLAFRFLGTYQVQADIPNMITLQSYITTLSMLCIAMGIVFEIPILCWLFGKLGLLTSAFMKKYRRHAIVLILIIGAFITPPSDIFTLLIVSLPIYLLYEASILLVRSTERV